MAKDKHPQPPPSGPEESPAPIDPVSSVGNHILVALGRPKDLVRVHVVRLWRNTYRANVFVGKSLADARCAHSYFVTTTDTGTVLASVPNLTKVYP